MQTFDISQTCVWLEAKYTLRKIADEDLIESGLSKLLQLVRIILFSMKFSANINYDWN